MPSAKPDLYNGSCPSRGILEIIGRKWSMLVVCLLRSGPARTGVLRRRIDGISQKMLTQTLRDLERHGIVRRISYDEVPPRVEYRLTRLGVSLAGMVRQMEDWVVRNYARMASTQREFDGSDARPRAKPPASAARSPRNGHVRNDTSRCG